MKLELTTWQRVIVISILNALRGPVAIVRKAGKLLDILDLSQEEKADIGLVELAPGSFQWKDAGRTWEMEIADRELAAFLKQQVQAFQDWPVARRADVEDLLAQLGVGDEQAAD